MSIIPWTILYQSIWKCRWNGYLSRKKYLSLEKAPQPNDFKDECSKNQRNGSSTRYLYSGSYKKKLIRLIHSETPAQTDTKTGRVLSTTEENQRPISIMNTGTKPLNWMHSKSHPARYWENICQDCKDSSALESLLLLFCYWRLMEKSDMIISHRSDQHWKYSVILNTHFWFSKAIRWLDQPGKEWSAFNF